MNPLTLLARCAQTAVRPATGLFERLSASVRCGRLAAVVILAVAGCQPFTGYRLPWSSLKPRSQSPDADDTEIDNEFQTRVRTPMIGDYTTFAGLNLISLEGVGLVTGLDNTGGDPPPSMYRTELIEAMKKRGVNNPNMVLRSPTTALVVVRAYLPPLVRKGDKFDVEVRLPANSEATSLRGGHLLEAYLSEHAIVPGRGVLQGHVFAKASGPILTSTGEGDDKESLAGVLRNGRILGGGTSLKERDMTIYLRNDFRSVRNSKRISDRIGTRFHAFDRFGIKEALAEAKTDQTILLKIPENYRDNYPRYLQVIRNIPFRETDVARRVRMQKLQKELHNPVLAEHAALELEAIGQDAEIILKTGLASSNPEVRFHSAVALSYLGNSEGLHVLAEAAVNEPAFRVFALAAMAVIDDGETHMGLRELMSARPANDGGTYDSGELRYGAFRALWTLDKNDPFIRGEFLDGKFWLHALDTQGEPMLHLTHRMRSEIVVFGKEQKLETPLVLRAGNQILITAAPGSDTVTVSRFQLGSDDMRREVSTRVVDVIRTAVEFGANYPDIAQMLAQADKQHNLPGRVAIDTLPQAGRTYYRPGDLVPLGTEKGTAVGRPSMVPNMFPNLRETDGFKKKETLKNQEKRDDVDGDGDDESGSGSASLADARKRSEKPKSAAGWERFDVFHIFTNPEFIDVEPLEEGSH